MGEDGAHDRVLDGGDDPQPAVASGTGQDIESEQASSTYYAAALVGFDGFYLRLYQVVGGVRTKLGQVPIRDHQNGGEIRIRVTGTGAAVAIAGFYRGKERLSATDSAPDRITGGTRAGIIGMGLAGYRWALDDWMQAASAVVAK